MTDDTVIIVDENTLNIGPINEKGIKNVQELNEFILN